MSTFCPPLKLLHRNKLIYIVGEQRNKVGMDEKNLKDKLSRIQNNNQRRAAVQKELAILKIEIDMHFQKHLKLIQIMRDAKRSE
jgi:hypothetical protein